MFESIAFYLGHQWLEYNGTTRRHTKFQAPSWFPTPVDNKIKPQVHAMVSRLVRSRAQGRGRPNSTEIEDRQAAQMAEKVVEHVYAVTGERMKRQLCAYYAVLGGTVIVEDYFNPRLGTRRIVEVTKLQETPIMQTEAACPTCGPQGGEEIVGGACPQCGGTLMASQSPRLLPSGEPAIDVERVPELDPETMEPLTQVIAEGDLDCRPLMLFNFYWDPKAKFLDEAQWCGEAFYADLDWIDENYPEFGPYVGTESGIEQVSFYEEALLSLVGSSMQGGSGYQGGMSYSNGVVVRKYQERPSRRFPNGLHLVTGNGVLLYRGELPLRDQDGGVIPKFSYTEFRQDLVPGRFPGTTAVEDMVPLQRRINGIDCQKIINRKTMMMPWLLAPKGSGLNPGEQHMKPGATVTYNYIGVGATPQVVHGVPLPAEINEERRDCAQSIAELAESAGSAVMPLPQNTRSGVALHWTKEQLDEYGIARLERWAEFHAERDRKRLLLAQQHYREPRQIKIKGEGSQWQIRAFTGADLRGNTDIVVEAGTEVPRSRSAQTQILFDAIEAGIIDLKNPLDRQKVIEELGLTRFETEIGPDRRLAQLENAAMDQGAPQVVQPEQDDDVHGLEHLMEMKSPEFATKPPEVQALFREHLAQHHDAKAAKEKALQIGAATPAGEEPRASTPLGGEPPMVNGGAPPGAAPNGGYLQ